MPNRFFVAWVSLVPHALVTMRLDARQCFVCGHYVF
jgi:hypothetical protein